MVRQYEQPKNKQLKVRLTDEQYAFVQDKAAAAKMTVSDFVWSAIKTKQVKGFEGKERVEEIERKKQFI